MPKIGVIGGSGIDKLEFGPDVIFINRHGDNYSPPHEIDARGNIQQLKRAGVSKIIAIAAVGSLDKKMKPGDLVLLSDFLDFTRTRAEYIDPRIFTDMSFPYDEDLRKNILRAAEKLGIKIHPGGVYACTEGPRFETKAEIKMYQKLGADVVGMTQVPEVVLAAEAGIPYAAIAIVTNYAAGITDRKVSSQEVLEVMKMKKETLAALISASIAR